MFDISHAKTFFEIRPATCNWDYTLLSIFLNNFVNMSPDNSRGFKTKIKNKEYNTRYIFRHRTYRESSFNIQIGMQIKVFASRTFLRINFFRNEYEKFSKNGLWDKDLLYSQWNIFVYYNYVIWNPSDGTLNLFYHKPLVFLRNFDFSTIFDFFFL